MEETNRLPHDVDAEQSLLGGLMFAPDNVSEIVPVLGPGDFWKPAHGHVYDAILEVWGSGDQPEVVPVAALLKKRGLLDAVGGSPGVIGLLHRAGAPSGLPKLAEIIRDASLLRKLVSAGSEIREFALSGESEPQEALVLAEDLVFSITGDRKADTSVQASAVVEQTLTRIDSLLGAEGGITGTRTGYYGFDKMTSGLQPGQFVVVGARPSMGKTAFALGMAVNAAIHQELPVLFFSLEMGRDELLQRVIASEGFVPMNALKTGNFMENHWIDTHKAMKQIEGKPLWIDDNPSLTMADIKAKSRRFKSKYGNVGLIIIDYIQLMTGRSGAESRQIEVSEISRGCKILAKDLGTTVVALSQLSRGLDNRSDKRPILSDLRESGAIEQDADIVTFLYRDEVYVPDSEFEGTAEVILAKQRSGPIGSVRMGYLGKYTKFINLSGVGDV